MEIRKIRAEEAEEVSRIYAASWKAAYRGIVAEEYLDNLDELRWAPRLAEDSDNFFVLTDGGQYIGAASLGPARDPEMKGWGEIVSIYLRPAYFHKGYGKALFCFCIKELKSMGLYSVCLWALKENRVARVFYEKFGFVHDGKEGVHPVGGENLKTVRYIYTSEAEKSDDSKETR